MPAVTHSKIQPILINPNVRLAWILKESLPNVTLCGSCSGYQWLSYLWFLRAIGGFSYPRFNEVAKASCSLAVLSKVLAVVVYLYLSLHLWLIVGIWCSSLSIGSFCLQAWKPSSLQRAPQTLDRHRGYLLSLQKLPNSYLLSSWLPLASLSLLPPTPSLILSSCFFSFELVHKAGVALRDSSVFKFFSPVFEPCLHTDSSRLPRACWCLLVQPSCALRYCDLMTASAKK